MSTSPKRRSCNDARLALALLGVEIDLVWIRNSYYLGKPRDTKRETRKLGRCSGYGWPMHWLHR